MRHGGFCDIKFSHTLCILNALAQCHATKTAALPLLIHYYWILSTQAMTTMGGVPYREVVVSLGLIASRIGPEIANALGVVAMLSLDPK